MKVFRFNEYLETWEEFSSTANLLRVAIDLENLVDWAERKHLQGQRDYYWKLLMDIEVRINRISLQQPRLVTQVSFILAIRDAIFGEPVNCYPGAAAKYRWESCGKVQ